MGQNKWAIFDDDRKAVLSGPHASPLAAARHQGHMKAASPSTLMLNHPSKPPLKIWKDGLNVRLFGLIRIGVKFCVRHRFSFCSELKSGWEIAGKRDKPPAEAASDRSAQAQCGGPAAEAVLIWLKRHYRAEPRRLSRRSIGGSTSMILDLLV